MNAHLLNVCLTAALLWAFWHFAWKCFAVDVLRQRLFTIRGELFLLAAKGKHGLTFDSPAYCELRASLNRRIRFAHTVSSAHIFTAIFMSWASKVDVSGAKAVVDKAISEVDNAELRGVLIKLQRRSMLQFITFMLMTSPMFDLALMVAFACALIAAFTSTMVNTAFMFVNRNSPKHNNVAKAGQPIAIGSERHVLRERFRAAWRKAVGTLKERELQSARTVTMQADTLVEDAPIACAA